MTKLKSVQERQQVSGQTAQVLEGDMKTTGIIILNFNDYMSTTKLLKRIANYKVISHIVVVDNCSTNNSFKVLQSMQIDRCDILQADKNGGYAAGNNLGTKYLISNYHPEIIFIANPDIDFEEYFIINVLEAFENNPEYSLLSGVCRTENGKESKTFWALPSYHQSLMDSSIVFRIMRKFFDSNKIDYKQNIMEVDVVSGSFFAIRSKIFEQIGFFDEGTFLFYEENILATKLKTYGYKSGIITTISFIHFGSVTITKTMKAIKSHKIHLKSKMYYELKYRNINKLQERILTLGMKYSVIETQLVTPIKNIIRKMKSIFVKVYYN